MQVITNGRNDLAKWSLIAQGRADQVSLAELFDGYDATLDFPSCSCFKELVN